MKYLLPWKELNASYICFERRIFGDKNRKLFYAVIWPENIDVWWANVPDKTFKTKEAAIQATDELLLKQGWKFISWEQAEKLSALL